MNADNDVDTTDQLDDGALTRGPGPTYTVNAKPGVGFTSPHPWSYDGPADVPGVWRVPGTGLEGTVIAAGTALEYVVFATFDADEADVRDSYASTAIAVDLILDGDVSIPAETPDHHGVGVDPRSQYDGKRIAVDQWTRIEVPLEAVVGRTVTGVIVRVDAPPRSDGSPRTGRRVRGFLDGIRIVEVPPPAAEPVGLVRTTRGTQSSDRFSRGNCAPLVGIPHGFVFGLPMTDGGNRGWPYSYHEANDADNRSRLQAFATSHIPSPWMGDRGVFQFFPSVHADPDPDRRTRALVFSHHHESDRPDRYAVALDGGVAGGGLDVELAAGCRSVWLRTRFPGDIGSIIFDQFDDAGRLDLSAAVDSSIITGFVDGPGGLVSVPRTYIYAEVDVPITSARMHSHPERGSVLGSVTVDVSGGRVATLAVGVSFIGVAQARRNLQQDRDAAPRSEGFDAIRMVAREAWREVLARLDVEGASPDQLISLYSSLYRLYLYPHVAHEYCDPDDPDDPDDPGAVPVYADPFCSPPADDGAERTTRPIIPGTLTVTDGFWDSYRASWPMRTLLTPTRTGELLDGFVEHYRRGGWVSRWSAPGPADIMTGTSSDAVFADAALADVPVLDLIAAYDSCLRNATTPSDDPRVGRKGLARSIFRGYTDTGTFEGMSWTVDAAINDAAIAVFSRVLADRYPQLPRAEEFTTNAVWFTARAAGYAAVFDRGSGFFRGRDVDGVFRPLDEFDPRSWGLDYTETNAWGTAFTAPHDGAGLVEVHGGAAQFEDRLDLFCALAETGRPEVRGWYPVVIHEMREARDTRMGMLALSNQPAHHIPFMYAYASRPGSLAHSKTQALLRDAFDRLFRGSEIGQGYPGDEDNGEMSAWYLWVATGLYPLAIGSGRFVITAPMLPRLSWKLESGARLEITAPAAGPSNPYIQRVWIDDETWDEITVAREHVMRGAHIHVDVGPRPSAWAQGSVPASLRGVGAPRPPRDLTRPGDARRRALGDTNAHNAFDDDSASGPVSLDAGAVIGWDFGEPTPVSFYTVTPHEPGEYRWTLETTDPDGRWRVVDDRQATFPWSRQTRMFGVDADGASYRLRVAEPMVLAQMEFFDGLTQPSAGTPDAAG